MNSTVLHSAKMQRPLWLDVLSALTWQRVATVEAIVSAYALMQRLYESAASAQSTPLLPALIAYSVGSWNVLIAALIADEFVRRGSRLSRVYPAAVLLAVAMTALVEWSLWLLVGYIPKEADLGMTPSLALSAALDVATFGAFGMMAYVQRQSAQRSLLSIRTAELERAEDERRLIESRLAATSARVDVRSLLDALAMIRHYTIARRPEAETALEALILELRTKSGR